MTDDACAPARISGRQTLSADWFKLERITLELTRADGAQQSTVREVYHNGPGAAVLPIDRARGTVLLARQFRVAAGVNADPPMLIELCAGMVDAGDDPADTIRKEAEQELGYRLRGSRKVFELYMSPGSTAEKLHLFVADYGVEDHIGRGGGLRNEGEAIEVLELTLAQAWMMVATGKIIDAKTVLMLQHVRLGDP